ncbi:MAG: hypothetical protein QF570_06050 [Myxococcota bacterium]|jgi:hypothetical protein|nr:hypothetical protein [Myxococcota bacterium]
MTETTQTHVIANEASLGGLDLQRWKALFWVAAFYNFSAATVALVAPEFHVARFFAPGTSFESPVAHIYTQAFWVSVFSFGMGYAIVARNPDRNHGILFLAALGKTYVCFAFARAWLEGSMGVLALVGGIGDLAFAVAFVWFLWSANVCHGRGWTG